VIALVTGAARGIGAAIARALAADAMTVVVNYATSATPAEALKLTSKHLVKYGVIDTVVPEPLGGAHRDPHTAAHNLEQFVAKNLRDLKRSKIDNLLERRYEKFRNLGVVVEEGKKMSMRSAG